MSGFNKKNQACSIETAKLPKVRKAESDGEKPRIQPMIQSWCYNCPDDRIPKFGWGELCNGQCPSCQEEDEEIEVFIAEFEYLYGSANDDDTSDGNMDVDDDDDGIDYSLLVTGKLEEI